MHCSLFPFHPIAYSSVLLCKSKSPKSEPHNFQIPLTMSGIAGEDGQQLITNVIGVDNFILLQPLKMPTKHVINNVNKK